MFKLLIYYEELSEILNLIKMLNLDFIGKKPTMSSTTIYAAATEGNTEAGVDQKKRALEALERRFSAKTNKEIQPQKQNIKNKLLKQDKTCNTNRDNAEEAPTDFLSKKGILIFSIYFNDLGNNYLSVVILFCLWIAD